MKVEDIKGLNFYTNNVDILKQVIDLNNYDAELVVDFYKRLHSLKITVEKFDTLAQFYIENVIKKHYEFVRKYLYYDENAQALSMMNSDKFNVFCSLVERIGETEDPQIDIIKDIFDSRELKTKYGICLFDLINLLLDYIDDVKAFAIVRLAAEAGFKVILIKKMVETYNAFSAENAPVAYKLITMIISNFKDVSEDEILSILGAIKTSRDSEEKLDILQDVLKASAWTRFINYAGMDTLINYVLNNNLMSYDLIYNPVVLKHRSVEVIEEMLSFLKEHPMAKSFLADEFLLENLLWADQKALFLNYILDDSDKYANFKKVVSGIKATYASGSHQIANLNDMLIALLQKCEYETTVAAYLEECNSIAEFIGLLTRNSLSDQTDVRNDTVVKNLKG